LQWHLPCSPWSWVTFPVSNKTSFLYLKFSRPQGAVRGSGVYNKPAKTAYTVPISAMFHSAGSPIPPILMNNSIETPWLTSREAANYLQVEPRTLLMWARQKKVKGYVLSGTLRQTWRFQQADLDAMLSPPSVALTNGRIH